MDKRNKENEARIGNTMKGKKTMNKKVQSGPQVPLYTGVAKVSVQEGQTCIRHTITVAGLWDTKRHAMEVLYIEGSPNVRTALRYQDGKIRDSVTEYSAKEFTFNAFHPDSTLLPIVVVLIADYRNETLKKGHYSFRALKIINTGEEGYKALPRVCTKEDVQKYIKEGGKVSLIRVKDMKTVDALNCFFGKKYNPFQAVTFLVTEPDANGRLITRETDNPVISMAENLVAEDDEGEPVEIKPAELDLVENDGVMVDRRKVQAANMKLHSTGYRLVINAGTKQLELRQNKAPKVEEVQPQPKEEVKPNDPDMGEIGNRFGDVLDAFIKQQA